MRLGDGMVDSGNPRRVVIPAPGIDSSIPLPPDSDSGSDSLDSLVGVAAAD